MNHASILSACLRPLAGILESMGLGRVGAPGATAARALVNDAVKKGGTVATSSAGGLSGAFLPVSEDAAMAKAAADGVLSIEKLEAMTAVCPLGLDMIVVPGDWVTLCGLFGAALVMAVSSAGNDAFVEGGGASPRRY